MRMNETMPAIVQAQDMVSDAEKLRALPWSLAQGVLNTFFAMWTFTGSPFLLFMRELGLPNGQIGLLLSLFPFCGLLALGFAPIAARWGRKYVFLACYGSRKFVMAALLLLPWTLAMGGHGAGMVVLIAVISVFALLRALAETAYYPWSQEFIPNHVRGKYTGLSSVLSMVASTLAVLIAGWVIGSGTGLSRFLLLIGAGCLLGVLGVAAMAWVPGGRPRRAELPGAHASNILEALHDRNLVAYLGGLGAVTMGTLFLTSFLPLFVKERLGIASETVVMLDAAVMVGGGLSSLLWGVVSDRVGSRPVLMSSVALGLLIPLGWLLLPRRGAHVLVWCILLYGAYGVVNGGIAIATLRLLFNGVIPPGRSTAYNAIYYAWIGLTGGLAPLLAGGILSGGEGWHGRLGLLVLDAYTLVFLLCLLLLIAGWVLFQRVKPDDRYTTRALLRCLLRREPLGDR